jgi:hypothetical protein
MLTVKNAACYKVISGASKLGGGGSCERGNEPLGSLKAGNFLRLAE